MDQCTFLGHLAGITLNLFLALAADSVAEAVEVPDEAVIMRCRAIRSTGTK